MSDKTTIEWSDASWNPVRADNGRHICARISPGCDRCYASTMTRRLAGVSYGKVGEPLASTPILDMDALLLPLKWRKPRRIFVCSMTDLFGEWMTDEWLDQIFSVMAGNPWHTFQVLTKRPKRMSDYCSKRYSIPENIWLGVTIESDQYAWRANYLRTLDAAVRWISAEPLLSGLPTLDLTGIGWCVVGGESGAGARPMHPDWARSLRDRCQAAGVAFHFKQHGEWLPVYDRDKDDPDWQRCEVVARETPRGRWLNIEGGQGFHGERVVRVNHVGKHNAGRLLDGVEWNEFPESKALVPA